MGLCEMGALFGDRTTCEYEAVGAYITDKYGGVRSYEGCLAHLIGVDRRDFVRNLTAPVNNEKTVNSRVVWNAGSLGKEITRTIGEDYSHRSD